MASLLECVCCHETRSSEFSNKQIKKSTKPNHRLRCNTCIDMGRKMAETKPVSRALPAADFWMQRETSKQEEKQQHRKEQDKRQHDILQRQEKARQREEEEYRHRQALQSKSDDVRRVLETSQWEWKLFLREQEAKSVVLQHMNRYDQLYLTSREFAEKLKKLDALHVKIQHPIILALIDRCEYELQPLLAEYTTLDLAITNELIATRTLLDTSTQELLKMQEEFIALKTKLTRFTRYEGFQLMIDLLQLQTTNPQQALIRAKQALPQVEEIKLHLQSFNLLQAQIREDHDLKSLLDTFIQAIHFVVTILAKSEFNVWNLIRFWEEIQFLPFIRFFTESDLKRIKVPITHHDALLEAGFGVLPDDVLAMIADLAWGEEDVSAVKAEDSVTKVPGDHSVDKAPGNHSIGKAKIAEEEQKKEETIPKKPHYKILSQTAKMKFVLTKHWHAIQDVLEGLKFLVPRHNLKLHEKLRDYSVLMQTVCLDGGYIHKTRELYKSGKNVCKHDLHINDISPKLKTQSFYYRIKIRHLESTGIGSNSKGQNSSQAQQPYLLCKYLRKWSYGRYYNRNQFHPSTRRYDIEEEISRLDGKDKKNSEKVDALKAELGQLNDDNDAGEDDDDDDSHYYSCYSDGHASMEFRIVSMQNVVHQQQANTPCDDNSDSEEDDEEKKKDEPLLPFTSMIGKRLCIQLTRGDDDDYDYDERGITHVPHNDVIRLFVQGIPLKRFGFLSTPL